MALVPEAYYQFVMDYAPYVYVIPPDTPDPESGRAAFSAAFAIDFLHEAYSAVQFESRRAEISNKIASLADWILTQQCTDDGKFAYGGFKSNEDSTQYYAVDACRVVPALLKAYEHTGTVAYLDAARLAGATFLYNMQHKPSQLGVHDKYYGGFARAITIADVWLQQMDIECLYGLVGLKMLCESDPSNNSKYESMINDAVGFCRYGFENLYLYYNPLPTGDGDWHRIGLNETTVYDDVFAYAMLGLYAYEGWSATVQNAYSFLNAIKASVQYPAYNPAICWAGYIDVVARVPACDYYDAVTSGILWQIRKNRDKPSFELSMQIVDKHQDEFMFWGVKHADYSPIEAKKALTTVCWLGLFYLNYESSTTRFTQILRSKGETVTLYPVIEAEDQTSYGEAIDIKAIVSPTRSEEVLIEPGYAINDYVAIYIFAPLKHHDKIDWKGSFCNLQQEVSIISRVIVHPKYRTIGLGARLVRETLHLAGTPYVEMMAVMAKHNPFAEKGGMQKIAEQKPSKEAQRISEALMQLGFNLQFLGSNRYVKEKLESLTVTQLATLKSAFIKNAHPRLLKEFEACQNRAYGNKADYMSGVESADLPKMVKLIKVLSVLLQSKIYLFKNLDTAFGSEQKRRVI
ncbi:hypothetical protein HXY33_06985 [Candidatus Bathyarchaeota archaeon]|nr:hypothetical protein [Candidatus Bathyarchaeota archaeon]